jgi:hypothetical protein
MGVVVVSVVAEVDSAVVEEEEVGVVEDEVVLGVAVGVALQVETVEGLVLTLHLKIRRFLLTKYDD